MPTVKITHGNETWSIQFKRSFYIQENSNLKELFWDSDSQRPGVIMIWVQYGDTDPRIAFVLPDWRITVDGILLEQKPYGYEDEDLGSLKGKKVLLSHGDWNFDFDFTDLSQ